MYDLKITLSARNTNARKEKPLEGYHLPAKSNKNLLRSNAVNYNSPESHRLLMDWLYPGPLPSIVASIRHQVSKALSHTKSVLSAPFFPGALSRIESSWYSH